MKLIVDSGSTKADWVLLGSSNKRINFTTKVNKMKNFTHDEENFIGRILQLILSDVELQPTIDNVENKALKLGVRIEACKPVIEFLLDHDECLDAWLMNKS